MDIKNALKFIDWFLSAAEWSCSEKQKLEWITEQCREEFATSRHPSDQLTSSPWSCFYLLLNAYIKLTVRLKRLLHLQTTAPQHTLTADALRTMILNFEFWFFGIFEFRFLNCFKLFQFSRAASRILDFGVCRSRILNIVFKLKEFTQTSTLATLREYASKVIRSCRWCSQYIYFEGPSWSRCYFLISADVSALSIRRPEQ